jgi:hypothetical protein
VGSFVPILGRVITSYTKGTSFAIMKCDLWDLESPLNPKLNRFSVHYRCKANHQSFIHPTDTRTPTYWPSRPVLLVNQDTIDDNDHDDDDNTYFMEEAQQLLCQESINGRHSVEAAEKEEMMNIHHNSVGRESKLPAKDFSLDTEEETTSQKPELHWRKKKKEANERFMVAVTQALNDVVTSQQVMGSFSVTIE